MKALANGSDGKGLLPSSESQQPTQQPQPTQQSRASLVAAAESGVEETEYQHVRERKEEQREEDDGGEPLVERKGSTRRENRPKPQQPVTRQPREQGTSNKPQQPAQQRSQQPPAGTQQPPARTQQPSSASSSGQGQGQGTASGKRNKDLTRKRIM